MTKSEFQLQFDRALVQYDTIDRRKCERFGALVQGFVGVKVGEDAHIIPFLCTLSQIKEAVDLIWDRNAARFRKSDFVGVSLVKHYIHYTEETKPSRK